MGAESVINICRNYYCISYFAKTCLQGWKRCVISDSSSFSGVRRTGLESARTATPRRNGRGRACATAACDTANWNLRSSVRWSCPVRTTYHWLARRPLRLYTYPHLSMACRRYSFGSASTCFQWITSSYFWPVVLFCFSDRGPAGTWSSVSHVWRSRWL